MRGTLTSSAKINFISYLAISAILILSLDSQNKGKAKHYVSTKV